MYDLHSILIQLKKEDTPLHGVMVRCVRCFYQWLDPTLWEGSALFELWAQELELIYGDLRQRLSPNAKTDAGSLGDRFGFDTPPELPRLLQSIQTFYSVLIKLIAWNTLRGAISVGMTGISGRWTSGTRRWKPSVRNCGPVWSPLTPVRKAAPFPRTVSAASTKPWSPRPSAMPLGNTTPPAGWRNGPCKMPSAQADSRLEICAFWTPPAAPVFF